MFLFLTFIKLKNKIQFVVVVFFLLSYERDKLAQQEKFKARLSAARDRRALTPTGRDISDSDIVSHEARPVASVDI